MISNDLRSSCRALLIGAYQDGGGGGDSDEWVYPPEWLQMPSAAEENTGYFLFSMREETESMTVYFNFWSDPYTSGSIVFDWGDGSTEEINKDNYDNYSGKITHAYSSENGHKIANGTVQFLVKVICYISYDIYGQGHWYVREVDTQHLKAASYHSGIDNVMYTNRTDGIIDGGGYMSYIALSGDLGNLFSKGSIIRSLNSIQKIDVTSTSKITDLYNWNFGFCDRFPEKSIQKIVKDVVRIGDSCFTGGTLQIQKMNFPELVEAGKGCFCYSPSLFKFEAPKLTTVGSGCFCNLATLNYFIASDEFDMEAAKANGCFKYTPRN